MLSKKELEEYLSLCMSSQADFAEIYEEDEVSETIAMMDGKTENINRTHTAGAGIRLYKGLQTVYAYTNDTGEDVMKGLINDLRSAIGRSEDRKSVVLARVEYENMHPAEIDFRNMSALQKTELLKRAADAAMQSDERIARVQASLLNVHQEVQISNSEGRLVSDTRVRTRMMVDAIAQEGEDKQSGSCRPGAGKGPEFYEEFTPEEAGREAARIAVVNLSAKPCPSGMMPVVIDNGFGGVIFHEACGHGLEASVVSKNQSVFSNLIGQKVASECVTAIDDGTIPNAWGSQNIDDEGNFQKKRILIENGILKSYLIDRLNGRRMNEESTSSSRRQSYRFEPTSRMTNTYIAAGTSSWDELFEGIERGLYAKTMGGGSVNPQTGEFNFSVLEGYLIENGKISYPVKGAALIGSGREVIMNIEKVASNLKRAQGMCGAASGSIPTDVGQPAIRISRITVGGTSNE